MTASRMLAVALIAAATSGCAPNQPTASQTPAPFRGMPAVAWIQTTLQTVRTEQLSPPVASRAYAYLALAMYAAVAPSSQRRQQLSSQINGFPQLPRAPAGYDPIAALAAATDKVADEVFPSQPAADRFNALRDQQLASERSSTDPGVVTASAAWGEQIGDLLVAWTRTDGYVAAGKNRKHYVIAKGPGLWTQTPPDFNDPVEPYWGTLRPMVLPSATSCTVPTPPVYSTDPTSPFYAQAKIVLDTSVALTAEQKAISWFWDDSPTRSPTPAGHWLNIVTIVAAQHGLDLERTVTAYALVGVATADAFIATWQYKYSYDMVRPITYIRDNLQANWYPFLNTPAFPSYPAGHSTQSASAASALTAYLGTVGFTDTSFVNTFVTGDGDPHTARVFTSFAQAADEAAISRIYGGIHYPSDSEGGKVLGRCIGAQVATAMAPA